MSATAVIRATMARALAPVPRHAKSVAWVARGDPCKAPLTEAKRSPTAKTGSHNAGSRSALQVAMPRDRPSRPWGRLRQWRCRMRYLLCPLVRPCQVSDSPPRAGRGPFVVVRWHLRTPSLASSPLQRRFQVRQSDPLVSEWLPTVSQASRP